MLTLDCRAQEGVCAYDMDMPVIQAGDKAVDVGQRGPVGEKVDSVKARYGQILMEHFGVYIDTIWVGENKIMI